MITLRKWAFVVTLIAIPLLQQYQMQRQLVASQTFDFGAVRPEIGKIYTTEDDSRAQTILPKENSGTTPTGVLVLGMHRSGTSLLTGLLTLGYGYYIGGPLLKPSVHNAKGYFETATSWRQNDYYFATQNITSVAAGRSLREFNVSRVLEHDLRPDLGAVSVLAIVNGNTTPWIHKDPRVCLTLPIWLHQMTRSPAILHTYRHPFDVASSMQRRDRLPFNAGLAVWMVYNQRAIEHSRHLCRITTSNEAIFQNPAAELSRIVTQLTHVCQVPAPPMAQPSQKILDDFIDPSLQKAKNNGTAAVVWRNDCQHINTVQKSISVRAMMLYCDLQSGLAYTPNYTFPDIPTVRFRRRRQASVHKFPPPPLLTTTAQ